MLELLSKCAGVMAATFIGGCVAITTAVVAFIAVAIAIVGAVVMTLITAI